MSLYAVNTVNIWPDSQHTTLIILRVSGLFSAEDSALAKDFQKLADAMNEDYRFAHSYSKEVHAKSKYEKWVSLWLNTAPDVPNKHI